MSTSTNTPYSTAAVLTDCGVPATGYSKPFFGVDQQKMVQYSNCDISSYSAYSLDPSYQGYYDDCPAKVGKVQREPDLMYLNASPKTVANCWTQCCANDSPNCTQECNFKCVVETVSASAPTGTPTASGSNLQPAALSAIATESSISKRNQVGQARNRR